MSKINFTQICNITTGKLDANAAEENGKYPYFTCAPEPLSINTYAFDDDVILLAGNNASGNFHCQRYRGKFNAYQRTYVITAKKGYNIDYVYYNLKINLQHLKNLAQGSQTKFLTMQILDSFEVEDIPIQKQRKITRLLTYIDRKIENNRRINIELEAIAKTIFDYWFLQYEFPNEEGKPYKSSDGKMVWDEELGKEIPEGWRKTPLKDIFSFIKGKIPEHLSNEQAEGLCPYITIDVANGLKSQFCSSNNMPYCDGEVIMVMDGAASGDVYIGNYGVLGSTFAMIKRHRTDVSDSLIYTILKYQSIVYKKANTGSTVPHANRKYIESIMIPVSEDMRAFSDTFDRIYTKIIKNKQETQELRSLRDFLLPLLMSGKVSFRDYASR